MLDCTCVGVVVDAGFLLLLMCGVCWFFVVVFSAPGLRPRWLAGPYYESWWSGVLNDRGEFDVVLVLLE